MKTSQTDNPYTIAVIPTTHLQYVVMHCSRLTSILKSAKKENLTEKMADQVTDKKAYVSFCNHNTSSMKSEGRSSLVTMLRKGVLSNAIASSRYKTFLKRKKRPADAPRQTTATSRKRSSEDSCRPCIRMIVLEMAAVTARPNIAPEAP